MNSKSIAYGILRAVTIITGVLILLGFLYKIKSILLYIAFASVISLMGRPLVLFLKKRLKFKNSLAVIFTLLITIGLVISIFMLFVPIITEQGQLLSKINISEITTNLDKLNQDVSDYFNVEKLNLVELIKKSDLMQYFDFTSISNLINSFLSGFGAILMGLFSVLFISFFLLKDSLLLENSLLVFVKKGKENKIQETFTKIKDLLSRYFVGLLLQVTILFILYAIILLIFKVHNPITVALIAAILNLIPYVGPLFGGVIVLMLTITSNLGLDFSTIILPKVTYVLSGYLIVQLIDNFLNQPLIFGNSVKSHPLEIFLAILVFGSLFGIGGLIVAVPFYTAIKVIAKEFLSEYKIVKSLTKDL